MEGQIYDATMVHSKQEGVIRSVSGSQKRRNWESKVGKMDSFEFLWTCGGAAVIGASLYLVSLI